MATFRCDLESSNDFPFERNLFYHHKVRLQRLKDEIAQMKFNIHEIVTEQKTILDRQEATLCNQLDNIYNDLTNKIKNNLGRLKTLRNSREILDSNLGNDLRLKRTHSKVLKALQDEISQLELEEFEVHGVILDKVQLLDDNNKKLFCRVRLTRSPYSERSLPVWSGISKGDNSNELSKPEAIKLHPITGDLFIADSVKNRIQVFSFHGEFKYTITEKRLLAPSYLCLSEEYLYVTCFNKYLFKFSLQSPKCLTMLQRRCPNTVSGLTMDNSKEKQLYVCSKNVKELFIYKCANLESVGTVKLIIPELEDYGNLTDLIIKEDNIYTLFTKSLNLFCKNGILLQTIIEPQNIDRGESYHFAMDSKGAILITVISMDHSEIKIYDGNGIFKCSIGKFGKRSGEFLHISGIAVSSNGDIIVCDLKDNNCVQKF